MISPTKTAEHVLVDGVAGERREFTIKATGKAFRTLIDGLYENKIGALVRELISNGYDSHAAAGISDVPVMIQAPTQLDPVFKVRDFGVSMDHETIMDLYSTIFESSKENTNDQVGMFGLGSKSPFAYTDTFTVTAFLDGQKRVYIAHISDNDIPQITHVATEQVDEPRGVEVTVPVQPQDCRSFKHEIHRNILASDVAPVVDGLTEETPKPLAEGKGWRIFEDDYGMGRFAIRQGCVVYPVHNMAARNVNYGYTVIVDVPIGSVDVTASRESLSLTPETTVYVRSVLDQADADIRTYGENITFENRLDAWRKHNHYQFLTFPVGKGRVNLSPDKPNKELPGQFFTYYKSAKKTGVLNQTDKPDSWIFLVERDGEKVLRKQLRIGQVVKNNKNVALINARDLPRIQRLFGLTARQVVSVASLPDVPVAPRVGTGARGGATGTAAPKTLAKGMFWLPKTGVKRIDLTIGEFYCEYADVLAQKLDWTVLGFTADLSEVAYLTEAQAKALGASPKRLFTTEVVKRAEKYALKHNFQAKEDAKVTTEAFHSYIRTLPVRSLLGYSQYGYHELANKVHEFVADALQAFVPTASQSYTRADGLVSLFLSTTGVNRLPKAQMDDTVALLVKPFIPLAKSSDPFGDLLKFYSENQ